MQRSDDRPPAEHPGGASHDAATETPCTDLLDRLFRFVEYRPRTAFETRERMRRWGYGASDIDGALKYLSSAGLVDDGAFARLFVEEMLRKGYGERYIREKLLTRRVGKEAVEEALSLYPSESEFERAMLAGRARARRARHPDGCTDRRRLYGYLVRRGFAQGAASEVSRLLSEVDSNQPRE